MSNIAHLITQMSAKQDLSYGEMRHAMRALMSGETTDIENAGFLAALMTKGETPEEIYAAAQIMRELSEKVPVDNPYELVDPVGTGGTHSRVFNVSTASSIVASCAGVKIAKHGNRAASSKSGSADLLEAAGVNIELTPKQMSQCVSYFGIGFMFAPQLHSAIRHVMPVRKGLGIRTIFNLLGPLTNPTGAKRQVLGVFDSAWLAPMADVCKRLGQTRVMVVNSADGLDEISIATPTVVHELHNGEISVYEIDPKAYDIVHETNEDVRVNSAEQSLALIQGAFAGESGAASDMIALNSAAIIQVASEDTDFATALAQAKAILASGAAAEKLSAYAAYTQSLKA